MQVICRLQPRLSGFLKHASARGRERFDDVKERTQNNLADQPYRRKLQELLLLDLSLQGRTRRWVSGMAQRSSWACTLTLRPLRRGPRSPAQERAQAKCLTPYPLK
jgi:hypothetical protein